MDRPWLATILQHIRQIAVPQHLKQQTDQQLLQSFCADRDPSAFAALVQGHGPMVLRVCQHVLHHAEDAEDAFQATFLVLARKAASIRKGEALPSWLHGVAYRIAVSARRSAARRRAREGQVKTRPQTDPSWNMAWREVQAVLDEEVQSLPEKYRSPFVCCFLEGRSQAETARLLGLKEGTVWSRLAKARQRLQQRLARRSITLSAVLSATAVSACAAPAASRLTDLTVQAALHYAAGKYTAAGLNSPEVAGYAQERLTNMFLTKMKVVLACVAVVALVTTSAGMVVFQMAGSSQPNAGASQDEDLQALAAEEIEPEVQRPAATDQNGDPLPRGAVARLGTVRFRQGGGARGFLAFSQDGNTLYSGGMDGIVHAWEAATGKDLRQFRAFTNPFGALAMSPNQKFVGAAVSPRDISLWDVATGKSLWQMTVPESSTAALVAFSPDGKTVASGGGRSDEVCLWEASTGQFLRQLRLQGNRSGVTRLEFSPDGQALLSKSTDGIVHFWDLMTGKELRKFPSNENLAPSYGFSPDGGILATGNLLEVVLWDLATGKQRTRLGGHRDLVAAIAYSPDGKTLVSAGHRSLHFWDTSIGKERHQVEGLGLRSAYVLRFSPDGKVLATMGNDSAIRLWDVATGKERIPRQGHRGPIYEIAFAPDGKALATAGLDNTLRLWDAATGQPVRVFQTDSHDLLCLGVSRDGKTLFAGDAIGIIYLWDRESGKEVRRLALPHDVERFESYSIRAVRQSADSSTIVALCNHSAPAGPGVPNTQSNVVMSWDVATGKQVLRREDLPDRSSIWVLSPDGRLRASYNSGPQSNVHEVGTGRRLLILDGKCEGLWPIAFSSDNRILAGVCHLGLSRPLTVVVWELATGKEIRRFLTEMKGLRAALAFSPDGQFLATGAQDEAGIQVWDLATGKEIARFRGCEASISSLTFASSGQRLASGLANSTALIWDTTSVARKSREEEKDLTTEQRQRLWEDLGAEDAGVAYTALWKLAAAPQSAVSFLKKHLRPAAAEDRERTSRLIADLDSDRFAIREAAVKELEKLGSEAEAAMRCVLAGKPSADVRRRLETLLAGPYVVRLPEKVRELRAVEILERIGTAEARQVLDTLANGRSEARLTQDANASLDRLVKRATRRP